MNWANKLLAGTLLTLLLGTMFLSLFQMSSLMDMSGVMTDCPFMSHEEVVCPMNLADHLGAWKAVFLSAIPTLIFVLTVIGGVVFATSIAPNLLRRKKYVSPALTKWPKTKTYKFVYRPLQDLFSNGILHPKIF